MFLTQHDNPLGRTIGNQIEIEETIECLHGNIPQDLEELVTKYGNFLKIHQFYSNSISKTRLITEMKRWLFVKEHGSRQDD